MTTDEKWQNYKIHVDDLLYYLMDSKNYPITEEAAGYFVDLIVAAEREITNQSTELSRSFLATYAAERKQAEILLAENGLNWSIREAMNYLRWRKSHKSGANYPSVLSEKQGPQTFVGIRREGKEWK